jgi:2-(1,2-epoxy-1,2-dihydrophenyl)acetyl-CoA isomerase
MTADPLLVERADGVVTLTLNRPDSLNSLDLALKRALLEAIESVDADPACRAVLLAGAGRAFCVGQDLKEHVEALSRADDRARNEQGGGDQRADRADDRARNERGGGDQRDARADDRARNERGGGDQRDAGSDGPLGTVVEHFNPLVRRLSTLGRPVVAAVRGMAAGAGASLAFLADFRIGGPSTAFLMAFANVGLAADTGASWTLPRLVGQAKATEMLMLAEPVRAEEAHRIGLLTRLVDSDDEVIPAAQKLAARLAAGPTVAYGQIKRQLVIGAAGPLDEALALEAEAQRISGATADHRNATAAFVAKQRPTFTGA